jgi:DNA-binding MarR family transcriptional regulator
MGSNEVLREEAESIAKLFHGFLRTLNALNSNGDTAVRELPLAQLRLCNALLNGPRPMSCISRELGISLSAITQIADRLERVRLVRRMPQGEDRRVRCLQLTEQGEAMMRSHQEERISHMARVLECLNPQERQTVASTFELLLRAAQEARSRFEKSEENDNACVSQSVTSAKESL